MAAPHRLLYNVLHPIEALCTFQVSVVLFVCPVRVFGGGAVGGLFISVYQSVRWLLGKAGLLLVFVHVVFLHLGVVCPYFGDFRVFVFVVFDWDSVCSVFLNGVLYLVELLPHVVGGGVVGRRVSVAALLSALPNAPIENSHQAADPGYCQHRAQQRHQEICFVFNWSPLYSDLRHCRDERVVTIALTDKVDDLICDVFDGVFIFPYIFCRNSNMYFIICQVRRLTGNIDGIFNRNILQNIQIPQFTANVLCGKPWCHHFFIEGEGDVGTVVLVVRIRIAFGLHRLLV